MESLCLGTKLMCIGTLAEGSTPIKRVFPLQLKKCRDQHGTSSTRSLMLFPSTQAIRTC